MEDGVTRRVTIERDLTLPAATLLHLRRAIQTEVGVREATHALHEAGFAAGEDFFQGFAREIGADPAALSEAVFWQELDRYFDARGWGRLDQERSHPAFGFLRARSWGESNPTPNGDEELGCAFSSGVFAYILGRVGGGPFAVLEVGCRSRGDDECSFLVGSEGAIQSIHGHLLSGDALDAALARL
jgi:predicted hydrocarbon binding protein